jgi:DNA invertase Pin-like site-specific DNA recombinase
MRIDVTTGMLFGFFQTCLTEIDNDHRSEAIRAGQARARAGGALVGRPRVIFNQGAVVSLKDDAHRSWAEIAKELGVSAGSVRRAYNALKNVPVPCQNSATEGL